MLTIVFNQTFSGGVSLAVRQLKNASVGGSSVTSQAPTFTSTTLAGSLLVVLINYSTGASSDTNSVTDGAGNIYTQAGAGLSDSASHRFEIWYCANATANAGTVTVTTNSAHAYFSVTAYEVTGAATSSPLNTTSSGHASTGTAIATGTITLVASSEIILAVMEADGEPVTAGTGYTLTAYQTYLANEYHITSSSEAATGTATSSANWGIYAASFKVAGSVVVTIVNRSLILNQSVNRASTY